MSSLRRARRRHRDDGASAVEYALLVAAIAAVVLAIVLSLAGIVRDAFRTTSECVGGDASHCQTTSP